MKFRHIVIVVALLFAPAIASGAENSDSSKRKDADKKKDSTEVAVTTKPPREKTPREQKAEVRLMSRITVTGTPTGQPGEIPGSVDRLTRTQIDHQNQAFDDIHRAMFRLPGVVVTEEEGFGLRPNIGMRASGTERSANITVMEDGVLAAPAPYSAPAAYYFPLMGRMEGVEVRKGSSQIKYGPRTNGGALNLQSTSIPSDFRVRLRASAGEYNSQKYYVGYGDRHGNIGWMLETYQSNSAGFKELDTGGNTGFTLQDYVGKVRWTASPDAGVYQHVELKLGYKDENSNETYLGLTDADFADSPNRRYAGSAQDVMDNDHRLASVRHFIMPSDNVDVTTTLYRNEFNRNWYKLDRVAGASISDVLSDPSAHASEYAWITGDSTSASDALAVKANNREYYSQGIESIVGWNTTIFGATNDMEFGIRFHRDEEDRFQWTDGWRMETGGSMVKTSAGVAGAAGGGDNRVGQTDAVATFWQDNIVMGRWTVVPGLRYEHIESQRIQYQQNDPDRQLPGTVTPYETDVLLPGIGLHVTLNSDFGALAGVHRGFAPPGPGASDETVPENSVNYEAGVRYGRGAVQASLIGFFNDYDNLLGKDTYSSGGSGSGDLYNAGAVDAWGVEAESRWTPSLGSNRLPVVATYTYAYAEFLTSFDSSFEAWGSVTAGDQVPYIPAHQLAVTVGFENPRYLLGVLGNYQSRMRTLPGQGELINTESTDARFILDLTGELVLGGPTRAFASFQNITDETYIAARRPAGVRPGLPRTFIIGLKLELN